jgi:predicted TIM-barrel fold metal-dependent hydrolase
VVKLFRGRPTYLGGIMRIDIHAHHLPFDLLARLARLAGCAGPVVVSQFQASASNADVRERLALMDRAEVDREVLSLPFSAPRAMDERGGVDVARCVNDAYADLVARQASRLAAFATVPLPFVDSAIAETDRALDTLGMVGVAVTTEARGRPLADPTFGPFFSALDRRRAVLLIHPSGPWARSTAAVNFTQSMGAAAEGASCLLQLVKADIPLRFPRIKIIFTHLVGCAPFLLSRQRAAGPNSLGPFRSKLSKEDARYFCYDTVNADPPALRRACQTLGAHRLLMGTNASFGTGDHHQRMVECVATLGLHTGEADAIYGGNALRLLNERLGTGRRLGPAQDVSASPGA